jgi:hypothetical protein
MGRYSNDPNGEGDTKKDREDEELSQTQHSDTPAHINPASPMTAITRRAKHLRGVHDRRHPPRLRPLGEEAVSESHEGREGREGRE